MSAFASLTGQAEVVARLRAAAAGEGMTHAWLFTGPPGSGRSVAARAFAAALMCDTQGCGACASCTQVRSGTSADLVVLTPEGLSISVKEARETVRRASLAAGGRWTVVLVEDADRLTDQAANALLKAIEEPEPSTVFLLCAPGPEDLLPTIRSRCRTITLRLPSTAEVAEVLVNEGVDTAMAFWAARAAQGHVGRARGLARDEEARRRREDALALVERLSTIGDALGAAADLVDGTREDADARTKTVATVESEALAEALGNVRGFKGAVKELEKRHKSRETRARRDELDRALVDLAAFYRDVLVRQTGASVELVHDDRRDTLDRIARATSPESTVRRVDAVWAAREAIEANVDPLLAVEAMALALRAG